MTVFSSYKKKLQITTLYRSDSMLPATDFDKAANDAKICCVCLPMQPVGMILIFLYHVVASLFFAAIYFRLSDPNHWIAYLFLFIVITEIFLAVLVIIFNSNKQKFIYNIYKWSTIIGSGQWGGLFGISMNANTRYLYPGHAYTIFLIGIVIGIILKLYSIDKLEKRFDAPRAAPAQIQQVTSEPVTTCDQEDLI